MPGKWAKKVLGPDPGSPPDRGSDAWDELVGKIRQAKIDDDEPLHRDRPFCGEHGGRRRDGWPCESPYVKESGRCKMHGGNHPRGVQHHNFQHGRASDVFKALPARFREAYVASLEDDDLLSLRADIALNDARIKELVAQLDTGENNDRWQAVGTQVRKLRTELALTDLDRDAVTKVADELSSLVEAHQADERSWREVRTATNHRRKLIDTERQRLKDLHAFLTADEALAIVARLTDAVIRHVENREALAAILQEVTVITGTDPRQRLSA